MSKKLKYISLFAGIGGFDLALNRLGHECVWANEWDKYAAQIYKRNFGDKPDERDIRTVPTSGIPDHDLLVGGFPCQSFSIAGKRKGFNDTRGTLFFEIARILKDKKTRLFILENVKGLLSHDNGFTFKTIISTLTELGYDLQWQVLNSKNFGVPQNRERVFIIGHLRGTPRPQVFPIGESIERTDEGVHETKITGALTAGGHSGGHHSSMTLIKRITHNKNFRRYNQTYEPSGIVEALDTSGGGGHQPCVPVFDGSIRRLTPIECERLQGFPDDWTKYGVDGELMSDTQRYKMCGNAVTTNVITEVVRRMFQSII